MNFKEVYSAANNSIKADRSLIEKIEAEASYKPGGKKHFFAPVYACGCALAAAALIIGVFSYNGMFANDNPYIAETLGKTSGEDYDKQSIEMMNEDKTENSEIMSPTEKREAAPKKEYAAKRDGDDTSGSRELCTDSEEKTGVLMQQAAIESVPESSGDKDIIFNIIDSEGAVASGGAALDNLCKSNGNNSFSSVSADEYGELMGINILSDAILPGDMAFESTGDIEIERNTDTGEIISDRAVFFAASPNGERYIKYIVESKNADVENAINNPDYLKSSFSGSTVVALSKENRFEAYIRKNKADICMCAENVTEEEFKQAVISVAE